MSERIAIPVDEDAVKLEFKDEIDELLLHLSARLLDDVAIVVPFRSVDTERVY